MVAARAPSHPVEVLAPFVDRQGVTGKPDLRIESHVVEPHPPIQQMEGPPPPAVTQADFPAHAVDEVAKVAKDDDDADRDAEQARPAEIETERPRRTKEHAEIDGQGGKREHDGRQRHIADGSDGVEHADEVRVDIGTAAVAGSMLGPETLGQFLTLIKLFLLALRGFLVRPGVGVLIDALHGLPGDALGGLDVAPERPVAIGSGNAAQRDHGAEAAHGVGTAAEAEQENAIVRPAIADQGGVAIDDVAGEAEAGCLADQIVEEVPGRAEHAASAFAGADAGIVERVLLGRVDRGIRAATRRAIQLVDVAAALVEQNTAALAGAIGIDHDVSWHGRPRRLELPSLPKIAGARNTPTPARPQKTLPPAVRA